MNDIKRLAGYIGPYKKDMMIGALMVMIETAFELVIPIMIADLIDVGVANHDLAYIYSKGFQMGICALLALVTGLLYARFAARASYGWGAKIREAEYAKVMQYSFSNLDHFDTSSLITRMTTDVTVLQNLINSGLPSGDERSVASDPRHRSFFLDESETCHCFSGVYAGSWHCFISDRPESGSYVYKASDNR